MKTTLVINDHLMRQVKQEAAKQRVTMSELVEAALRRFFNEAKKPQKKLPPLPTFHGGKLLVDIANREALYEAMEPDGPFPGSGR